VLLRPRIVVGFRRESGEASGSPRRAVVARPSSGSVRRTGKGWQARATHLGRQVAVGTFATRGEAFDALAIARSQVRDGQFIASSASRVSFELVVERWWQTRERHRPSTRARDRNGYQPGEAAPLSPLRAHARNHTGVAFVGLPTSTRSTIVLSPNPTGFRSLPASDFEA
jgi:hypothetical protein